MAKFLFAILFALGFFSACVSSDKIAGDETKDGFSQVNYDEAYEMFTDKKQIYEGLHLRFEAQATLLVPSLAKLQAQKKAKMLGQDAAETQKILAEIDAKASERTLVFVSFYSPDRKNDDLIRSKNLWRVFLDAGGRRFEGDVKRVKTQQAELQSIYKEHTSFHSAYEVSFPVAAASLNNLPVQMVLTGPVGSATLKLNRVE